MQPAPIADTVRPYGAVPEEALELERLASLRRAIRRAVEAARDTGEPGPARNLRRELDTLRTSPPPRTPAGTAVRARCHRLAALIATRVWNLGNRARLRAFADKTPSIYRESDRARLPCLRAYDRALAAVNDLPEGKRGLLVWGDTGRGKTRAMFEAARLLIGRGDSWSPRIVAPGEIKSAAGSGAWPDLRDDLVGADLLILDDLSHARFSEAYAAALLDLVERVTADDDGPVLLASVQCTGRELISKWCGKDLDLRPTAEAIARRLAEFLVCIEFSAKS